MTLAARNLLTAFESLDPAEQQQVAVEILRRSTAADELADHTFDELAADVFQSYDAEDSNGVEP
jgi:hypothetical protein